MSNLYPYCLVDVVSGWPKMDHLLDLSQESLGASSPSCDYPSSSAVFTFTSSMAESKFPLLEDLRATLAERPPFCSGTLELPEDKFELYYGQASTR